MKLQKPVLLVLILVLLSTTVFAAGYPDVTEAHWAHAQIEQLSGEITGYPDGTFRPEASVSRAEFLSLFVRLVYPEALQDKTGDVWWEPVYEVCVEKRLMSSIRKDADFMNAPMPRGEIAKLLGRYCSGWDGINEYANAASQFMINWEEKRLETPEYPMLFSDMKADSKWLLTADGYFDFYTYSQLLTCVDQGLMTGYPDGTFRPDNSITRAEAAAVLSRLKTQIALRKDGVTYLCTVGQYWLAQWEKSGTVGLSLYDPLTGMVQEQVRSCPKKDLSELSLRLGAQLLSGSDGECVWGLFGLYRKNGDTLEIVCSDPVLDFCMDGETLYYLTCDFSEPAYYIGGTEEWLCADTVCCMTWEGESATTLVLASCDTEANGIRKAGQNLTDICFRDGKLYVMSSYFMGMTDHHGALYEVKDGALAAIFGQL